MKEIVLTVGPHASGKSTFCEKVINSDPSIAFISLEQLLLQLFGGNALDPEPEELEEAIEMLWRLVQDKLASANTSSRIILDTWTESPQSRQTVIKLVRAMGADRVVAWYFTTPLSVVKKWFWLRPGIAKARDQRSQEDTGFTFYPEDTPAKSHANFHHHAKGIGRDGFDEVIEIDPITTEPIYLTTNK